MAEEHQKQLILVTGATGNQGGAVACHLVGRGFPVRALTRDPNKPQAQSLAQQGIEVVQGDLNDPDALKRALVGCHGVFSVQNFWEAGYDAEVRQGKLLADQAQAAGVNHFVYSSVGSAHRGTGIPHFDSKWEVEKHVRSIGIKYTILRPVFFMDNWQIPMLRGMILDGILMQPLSPSTRLQQIAVDDIGIFAAMAFETPDNWMGRELDIAGDEPTMEETAATFSRVIGRPVQYQQAHWDDFQKQMGEEYTIMYRWFEEVGYEADIPALRKEHADLKNLEQFLREHEWENAQAPSQG